MLFFYSILILELLTSIILRYIFNKRTRVFGRGGRTFDDNLFWLWSNCYYQTGSSTTTLSLHPPPRPEEGDMPWDLSSHFGQSHRALLGWGGSQAKTLTLHPYSLCFVAATRPRRHAGTTPRWPSSTSLWVSNPAPLVLNVNLPPPPHSSQSPLIPPLCAAQPTWTTCGSRPTGRPWSSGACRRPSAVSIPRMYFCPFQVFVSSPCIYFGLLQPSALSSRVLRFPAFRPSHSSSSSSLSFLLLWFALFFFSPNSPLFLCFFVPIIVWHILSHRNICSLRMHRLYAYTVCVCVGGSCLLALSRLMDRWSVSCPRAVTCAIRC